MGECAATHIRDATYVGCITRLAPTGAGDRDRTASAVDARLDAHSYSGRSSTPVTSDRPGTEHGC
jgi:hypothetical protein